MKKTAITIAGKSGSVILVGRFLKFIAHRNLTNGIFPTTQKWP